MTGIGAYVLYMKKKVVKDAFDFFLDPSTLMCTGGAIVVFITFFGCMGALRENTCLLKTVRIN
jgi:tetraspanin-33